MKRTAVVLLALVAVVSMIFTACNRDNDNNLMDDNANTTAPATTMTATTGTDDLLNDERDPSAGVPESTSQDSAIGDIADGIGDAADDIGDAAERAADGIGNADNRMGNNNTGNAQNGR